MQRVRGVQQVQGVQVRRVQGARQMLALCLAVIALSGTVRSQQADYVRRIAEAAKARNEQARCVIHESGGIVMTDFDDDLKRNSVFLVTPTGRNVVLNLGSTIATLHWLTIDETLAQRPVDSMACLGEIRNAPPQSRTKSASSQTMEQCWSMAYPSHSSMSHGPGRLNAVNSLS